MQRAATAPEVPKAPREESPVQSTAGKTRDSINVLLATLSALGYDVTSELPDQQLAYSEQDVAGLLGISPRTLFTLRKEGKVRAVRIGKRVIYSREELQRFLANSAD